MTIYFEIDGGYTYPLVFHRDVETIDEVYKEFPTANIIKSPYQPK
jgi:hypothetical protein